MASKSMILVIVLAIYLLVLLDGRVPNYCKRRIRNYITFTKYAPSYSDLVTVTNSYSYIEPEESEDLDNSTEQNLVSALL
jgi:hypothetical protein